MENINRLREWLKENAPMLTHLYQNKYVGMVYDRFASLPINQQKQVVMGSFVTIILSIILYFAFAYLALWGNSSKISETQEMVNLLLQYQRNLREKSGELKNLDRNSRLLTAGQLKDYLLANARAASISARMMQVEEKTASGQAGEPQQGLQLREASVALEKINLAQLKAYLEKIEFGEYNLDVSQVKITNDEKIRGYMKVELGVTAKIYTDTESGG